MTGIRSFFVPLAMLAVHVIAASQVAADPVAGDQRPIVLADDQTSAQPGKDLSLRQRAEDLARSASERFSEILSGKTAQKSGQPEAGTHGSADQGAGNADDTFAPVRNWLTQASKDYQDVVIAKFKNPSGEITVVQASPAVPADKAAEQAPVSGFDALLINIQEWLARANRSYRTEIVKELVQPSEPPARSAAETPSSPAEPLTAPQAPAPAPQPAPAAAPTETGKTPSKAETDAAEAKRLAEADAKKQSDAPTKLREDAEAKDKADAAKRKAEARRVAAEETERKAEAKRKAEVEARHAAEAKAEARRAAAEEAERKVAAKHKADAEAKRVAEEEAQKKAEAKRAAVAEANRKAEAEAKRVAEENAKRKAEAQAKRVADEEEKRKAEAERVAKEAEASRKVEDEAERKAVAEAKSKRMAPAPREPSAPAEPPAERSAGAQDARAQSPSKSPEASGKAKAREETVIAANTPAKIVKKRAGVAKLRHAKKRVHKRGHARRAPHVRTRKYARTYWQVPTRSAARIQRGRHVGRKLRKCPKVYSHRSWKGAARAGSMYVVRRGASRRHYGKSVHYRTTYRAERGGRPGLNCGCRDLYISRRRR